jgi:arabinose-5-phosphate isomerase
MNDKQQLIIDSAKKVLDIESKEILNAKEFINESFAEVITKIDQCKGRVILSGMGKSGHIARKIASTLSSTGTPSFFMHPGEASHGDLGMITKEDVVIFLSNSGESNEIFSLIPIIKRIGALIISVTGNSKSDLACYSDFHISSKVRSEACPLNLAPTASSSVMLAIGDAVAVSLFQIKGFTADDFIQSHPGGALGKNGKFIKIKDIMRSIDQIPIVHENTNLRESLEAICQKKVGYVVVVNNSKPVGIFTDGDLRRNVLKNVCLDSEIKEFMNKKPFLIDEDSLGIRAADIMEEEKISSLIVINSNSELSGVINFQDLLTNKVI